MLAVVIPCSSCDRFVERSARQCPFCGASIRLATSPVVGGFGGMLLGLALAACTPDSGDDSNSTVADSGPPGTTGPGMTSLDDAPEAEVAAYAGPGSFTDTTTGPDPDTGDTTAVGSSSGSGSSSSGGSGSDSGSGTAGTN